MKIQAPQRTWLSLPAQSPARTPDIAPLAHQDGVQLSFGQESTASHLATYAQDFLSEFYAQPDDGLGDSLLGRGVAGPEVEKLQKMLNEQGFELEEDGIYGPKTQQAVKDFQAKQVEAGNDIKVDGIVGPETRAALAKAPEPGVREQPDPSETSDKSPSVREQPDPSETSDKTPSVREQPDPSEG
ncbi:MAG: peptidoglycan-binding protein [Vulcanimicrobiota bacterium]